MPRLDKSHRSPARLVVKLRQPPRTPSLLRAVEVLQIGFERSQLDFVIVGIGVDRLRVVRRRWGRGLWFRRPFLASAFSGKLRSDRRLFGGLVD